MPRIDASLRRARERCEPAEAELLLAHVLGQPRGWLYAHGDDEIDADAAARFHALVARRVAGEPVAYLIGHRGFWRFDLQVTDATLIPRPETELLVELALARLPHARVRIADLGTGTGAIALALAFERRDAAVVATDASEEALAVARINAESLGLAHVELRHGDWFAPLSGERFDLIASNPPYIADTDPHLGEGDLRHEPISALASGPDGLDALRRIAHEAPAHLRPDGWLLVEHGWEQGSDVRALFEAAALVDVATERDWSGHERVTLGRMAGPRGAG